MDEDYDFWESIGIDPSTTMENWNSPSNYELDNTSNYIDLSQYGVTEIPNPTTPGQEGYGWRYFSDGTVISPNGKYYANNPDTGKTELVYDPASGSSSIINQLLSTAKGAFIKKDAQGRDVIDWPALGTAGAGLYQWYKDSQKEGGYNKPVPKMEAVRQQIQYDDTNRRPGAAGRQYFTDTQYVPQGDAAAKQAAIDAASAQAQAVRAAAPTYQAQANPWAGKMNLSALTTPAAAPVQQAAAGGIPQIPQATGFTKMASGGIARLAEGGQYLQGPTDGMADELDTTIDGEQPAKLSHGEFVIPADVVSHLGNGNSEAGAQKLYEMMARIRKARTGTTEQGKEIDPDEFTMGGIAKLYASGGQVQSFADGGTPVSTNVATPAAGAAGIPLDTSRTSTLSPWVGDYVTGALGEGAAVAAQPYQAYTGPLTAGPSGLQQQAFAGASEMAQTGYTPTQFTTGTFNTQAVQQYMNPYLEAALQPQLAEMNRQAQMKRMEDAARLTKAGAYGGGRQAVMESEGNRNLLDLQRKALGEGYATAYDKAMGQFNTQQQREMEAQKATEASRQFGGEFGLKSLQNLANLGATQRDIEQAGIAADIGQFEEQRDYAYKMPQYKLNLLQGLPIGAQTSSTDQSGLSALQSNISGLASIYKTLAALGQTPTK